MSVIQIETLLYLSASVCVTKGSSSVGRKPSNVQILYYLSECCKVNISKRHVAGLHQET